MPERAYRLTLTSLPGGAPALVRLRQALKTLLRMYRFRCRAVEELDPDVPATPWAVEGGVLTLRRLLCALVGHRPGVERFRYAALPRELAQWPNRRGATRLEPAGRECARCLRPIEEAAR